MARPVTRLEELERFNAHLEQGTIDTLRELAASQGYIVTSGGKWHGQGSISKMLHAMAETFRQEQCNV